MDLPRMTVVTPSYNQGTFIGQTIESVLGQGYPNLEYIVVDGGSTDGTLEVLQEYGKRVIWVSERDGGQAEAINKGLRMASGEVLAYLNSDDTYEPGALLAVGEYFARRPEMAWLSGRCRTVDHAGGEVRQAITLYKNLWLRLASYQALLVLNYVSQPATFWRRKAMDGVGYLDESLYYVMDYDYWLRIGRQFPLSVVDRYLARFRIHAASKSGSSAQAQFDEEFRVARRYTGSRLLMGLHGLHRMVAVATYRWMLSNPSNTISAR